MSSARPAAPAALSPRAWGALLVLCSALFLDALDVSMVGIALPSIGADLDLTTSQLQWIVSAYVLGYGGFLLLGGRAADLLGRRRMFLISLAVFALASGLGAFVDDGSLLIATALRQGRRRGVHRPGRALDHHHQLRGGAGAQPRHRHLHRDRRDRLLARAGDRRAADRDRLALGLLRAGPDRAGHPDRRHQARARRRPRSGAPGRSFDLAGASAITAAMLLACSPSSRRRTSAGRRRARSSSFAGVAALLAGFVALERRTAHPLVRLGILRSGSLVRANLGAMSLFGGWVGFQFIATLYMQQVRGWSPLETGLAIFPGGARGRARRAAHRRRWSAASASTA